MHKIKKAFHDYFIEETYEAGLVLQGTEIKSIRAGRVNLKDAFARVHNGEVWVHNMHISTYEQGNRFNHDPLRTRKLLLHKKEIEKLAGASKETGYALVPVRIYLKNGFAKMALGLAKGKKQYDKRHDLKEKEAKREIARAFRDRQKDVIQIFTFVKRRAYVIITYVRLLHIEKQLLVAITKFSSYAPFLSWGRYGFDRDSSSLGCESRGSASLKRQSL